MLDVFLCTMYILSICVLSLPVSESCKDALTSPANYTQAEVTTLTWRGLQSGWDPDTHQQASPMSVKTVTRWLVYASSHHYAHNCLFHIHLNDRALNTFGQNGTLLHFKFGVHQICWVLLTSLSKAPVKMDIFSWFMLLKEVSVQ